MIGLIAAAIAALAVPVPDVQQPPPWQDWKYARPVALPSAQANGAAGKASAELVRFALPGAVYAQARPDLADLRVIDAAGAQQPFAIDQIAARTENQRLDATLSEQGFVPGRYTQAVADVGLAGGILDRDALRWSGHIHPAALAAKLASRDDRDE